MSILVAEMKCFPQTQQQSIDRFKPREFITYVFKTYCWKMVSAIYVYCVWSMISYTPL